MAVQLIGRSVNVAAACNVGGPPEQGFVVFEVEFPALEAWLRGADKYEHREILGFAARPPTKGEHGCSHGSSS